MNMTFYKVEARVPVTVLAIHGDLDGSTYESVIAGARSLYDKGTRNLLLDLSDVPYMSSAGVVALQSIAAILRGESETDLNDGWGALHSIESGLDGSVQSHLKLLNPQPNVDRVLEAVGLKTLIEVHAGRDSAVASF